MLEGWQFYLRMGPISVLVVKGKIHDEEYSIVNIYVPNSNTCACNCYVNLQKVLLEFGISQEDCIIVGGDFNCPFNPLLDKKGGILISCSGVIQAIEGLEEQFCLHDIWRIKNPEVQSFTWSQKSPFLFCMETYLQDFQYKLLNYITCTNILPRKLGNVDSNVCSFCNFLREELEHLLFVCPASQVFWNDFRLFCIKDITLIVELLYFSRKITNLSLEEK